MRAFGNRFYRILIGLLFLAVLTPLQAAPLNLSSSFPDFVVDMGSITYDSGTKTMSISGTISSYTETNGGTQFSVFNTEFSLMAELSPGNCPGPTCVTSGSFSLFGEVRDPLNGFALVYDGFVGNGSGDPDGLLQGELTDFGWAGTSNTTGIMEFTFSNTSGILATGPLTQGAAAPNGYNGGGMILTVDMTNLANPYNFNDNLLTTSWSGSGFGDVFVPVPAAVWLFGSGLVALLGAGVRRRRSLQV